jgi:DNA repair exonuclease SbcCD ATPase subunit
MKIKEFKSFIREEIIGVLSEDTIDVPVDPNKLTQDQKRNFINTAKVKTKNPTLGTPANPVDFVEEELNEMAVSYNLNVDKAQELKDIIDKAKEGNTKKVLNYLLDKEVIPSMKTVANDLGLPDSASFNTRAFRDFMLMLKDKGIVSMGGAAPKAAAVKPSKEKIEKAVKAVEKDMETGEEGVDDIKDREPTKAELEKEKIKGAPSKFKISQEQYEKLKKTLKTVVDKVQELDKKIKDPNSLTKDELKDLKDQKTRKIESLKQFIKNPELVKAFNERGVQIDTDDLVG